MLYIMYSSIDRANLMQTGPKFTSINYIHCIANGIKTY